jgi:hypothetical protein
MGIRSFRLRLGLGAEERRRLKSFQVSKLLRFNNFMLEGTVMATAESATRTPLLEEQLSGGSAGQATVASNNNTGSLAAAPRRSQRTINKTIQRAATAAKPAANSAPLPRAAGGKGKAAQKASARRPRRGTTTEPRSAVIKSGHTASVRAVTPTAPPPALRTPTTASEVFQPSEQAHVSNKRAVRESDGTFNCNVTKLGRSRRPRYELLTPGR